MQLNAPSAATVSTPVLASQTIDITARPFPGGGAVMHQTEREFRLAGARTGIDVFTNIDDAFDAASALSAGSMPGLAVVAWRGGYRIHDVHASSRTYVSTSTHAPFPPSTRETARTSVPFAGGNLRMGEGQGRFNPAVIRSDDFVALIDGDRAFVPHASKTWAGREVLTEARLVP